MPHARCLFIESTILAASAGWRKLKCEMNMCACDLLFWSVLCWWIHIKKKKWVVFQRVEMKKDVWNGKMIRTFIWRTWKLNKLKLFTSYFEAKQKLFTIKWNWGQLSWEVSSHIITTVFKAWLQTPRADISWRNTSHWQFMSLVHRLYPLPCILVF